MNFEEVNLKIRVRLLQTSKICHHEQEEYRIVERHEKTVSCFNILFLWVIHD